MRARWIFWLVLSSAGCNSATPGVSRAALDQVTSFGANPGNLNMYRYVPAGLSPGAPLVVALHACDQTAADYVAAGWNELADQARFAVLYPEQKTANNSVRCFNWSWDPSTPLGLERGMGENESIKEMVDQMKTDFAVDPLRVYVTGFSAGGAEAVDLLALWPDVFAAGAPIAAIPYGCAASASDTANCLSPGITKTAAQWGTLVRGADPGFAAVYPPVSLWHGASDGVVAPANLDELVKQWTNVLGVDANADATDTTGALTHRQFRDGGGVTRVDSFELAGLNHQVPVDPTHGCGTAGTYFADTGVCASRKIAELWGLTAPGSDGGVGDGGASTTDGSTTGGGDDGGSAADGPGAPDGGGDPGTPVTPPSSSGCTIAPGGAAPLPLVIALLLLHVRRRRLAG